MISIKPYKNAAFGLLLSLLLGCADQDTESSPDIDEKPPEPAEYSFDQMIPSSEEEAETVIGPDKMPIIIAEGAALIEGKIETQPAQAESVAMPNIAVASFDSDGKAITFAVTFTGPLTPIIESKASGLIPVEFSIDLDNDVTTGETNRSGRKGLELEIPIYIGVEYDNPSLKGFHWEGGVEGEKLRKVAASFTLKPLPLNSDNLSSKNFSQPEQGQSASTIDDYTISVTIPYHALNITPGQTIRIVTKEALRSGISNPIHLTDLELTVN